MSIGRFAAWVILFNLYAFAYMTITEIIGYIAYWITKRRQDRADADDGIVIEDWNAGDDAEDDYDEAVTPDEAQMIVAYFVGMILFALTAAANTFGIWFWVR